MSVSQGGTVEFILHPGTPGQFRVWLLLASASGTQPGLILQLIPPIVLRLHPDAVFFATLNAAVNFIHPELIGIIPANGRDTTSFTFPPGAYGLPPGTDLHFAYPLLNPLTAASNPVRIRLVQ